MDYPYFLIKSNDEFWNGKCFADRSQAKPYATERGAISVARKVRSQCDRPISVVKAVSEDKEIESCAIVVNSFGAIFSANSSDLEFSLQLGFKQ